MTQLSNTPQIAVPDGRINPAFAGGPTAIDGLAQGAVDIGGALRQRDEKRKEMERQRQIAAGMTDLMLAEAEAYSAAGSADPALADQVYADAQKKYSERLSQVTNEDAREYLGEQARRKWGLGAIGVRNDSFKRLREDTVSQYRAAIDKATELGQYDTARDLHQQLKPYIDADDWVDEGQAISRAQEQNTEDAIKADIDFMGAVLKDLSITESERTEVLAGVRDAIHNSGLDDLTKKQLQTRAMNTYNAVVEAAVVDLEQIASDTDTLHDLQEQRTRAIDLIPQGQHRERLLAHIDSRIRDITKAGPDIDIGIQMYDGKPVPEGTKPPGSDQALNSVYQHGLDVGDSPDVAIGVMLDAGFNVAPKAVSFIKDSFSEGGNRVEGVKALTAIQDRRPNEAERIAREIGDDAETLLWSYTTGREIGLVNDEQFEALANSSRTKTQTALARNILHDADGELDYSFSAFEYLKTRREDTSAANEAAWWIGSAFVMPISVMNGVRLLTGGGDPPTASEQLAYEQAFESIYTQKMIEGNINTNDEAAIKAVVKESKALALDASTYYTHRLPTGPNGSDIQAVNVKPFGLEGKGIGPGKKGLDLQATPKFVEAIQDGTTVAMKGYYRNLLFQRTETTGTINRQVVADLESPFSMGQKTIIPLVRKDAGDQAASVAGFIEWDRESLAHRVILPSNAKPKAQQPTMSGDKQAQFGMLDPKVNEPKEVYDDALFEQFRDASQGIELPKSLSPYRWDQKFGKVSVVEHSRDWAKGFIFEAKQRVAASRGVPVGQVLDLPGGREEVYEEADSLARSAGWTQLIPSKEDDGRTDDNADD